MNNYRILVYRENCNEPIVLSDQTEDDRFTVSKEAEKIFTSPKICQFVSSNSILITRPSRIDAIEIFQENKVDIRDDENRDDENVSQEVEKNEEPVEKNEEPEEEWVEIDVDNLDNLAADSQAIEKLFEDDESEESPISIEINKPAEVIQDGPESD